MLRRKTRRSKFNSKILIFNLDLLIVTYNLCGIKLISRIWEPIRRENNVDMSVPITCAIHHLVLPFHLHCLPLCHSYLCDRGHSGHFYSEFYSIKNYKIDVLSHGYFKPFNSTQGIRPF